MSALDRLRQIACIDRPALCTLAKLWRLVPSHLGVDALKQHGEFYQALLLDSKESSLFVEPSLFVDCIDAVFKASGPALHAARQKAHAAHIVTLHDIFEALSAVHTLIFLVQSVLADSTAALLADSRAPLSQPCWVKLKLWVEEHEHAFLSKMVAVCDAYFSTASSGVHVGNDLSTCLLLGRYCRLEADCRSRQPQCDAQLPTIVQLHSLHLSHHAAAVRIWLDQRRFGAFAVYGRALGELLDSVNSITRSNVVLRCQHSVAYLKLFGIDIAPETMPAGAGYDFSAWLLCVPAVLRSFDVTVSVLQISPSLDGTWDECLLGLYMNALPFPLLLLNILYDEVTSAVRDVEPVQQIKCMLRGLRISFGSSGPLIKRITRGVVCSDEEQAGVSMIPGALCHLAVNLLRQWLPSGVDESV